MVDYKRLIKNNRNRRLTEEDDIEEVNISDRISEIVSDLGYDFRLNKNNANEGSVSISDNLSIFIRLMNNEISRIYIKMDVSNNRIDCTRNTSTADNISVDMQTCVLIIKDIKQKLM